jgi:hypothetical protein
MIFYVVLKKGQGIYKCNVHGLIFDGQWFEDKMNGNGTIYEMRKGISLEEWSKLGLESPENIIYLRTNLLGNLSMV